MDTRLLVIALPLLAVTFAGCFSGSDEWDFKPGENFEVTGKTVHLRMWVVDMVQSEIYPGFQANLWAFCAEAADPNDAYSRNAIEHRNAVGRVGIIKADDTIEYDDAAAEKCSVPGPQIRVKQGDRVIVDFVNNHFHAHTIHWHGQYVPWESDGVPGNTQDSVVKDSSFTYDFIARRAGTMWYHCHVDVQFHVMQGLYGVIIVEPQETKWEPKDIDREFTLVLSTLKRELVQYDPSVTNPHAGHGVHTQCGASGVPGCQNPSIDVTPDTYLINGRSAPNTMMDDQTVVKIDEGERVRIRFLNAGETVETIHTHAHDMQVTHIDGNPLHPNARYFVDTLMIGPAQRYDVVIEGIAEPGAWMMHTHVEDHVTNDFQFPGGMMTMIVYPGYEDKMRTFSAEAWGGLALPPDLTVPDDVLFADQVRANTAPGGVHDALSGQTAAELASWSFDVVRPCAVDDVTVTVRVLPDNEAFLPFTDVDVSMIDPGGATRPGSGAADEEGLFRWTFDTKDTLSSDDGGAGLEMLQNGTYTVKVDGNTVDSTIVLNVLVDYFRDMREAVATAKAEGWNGCGLNNYLPDVI